MKRVVIKVGSGVVYGRSGRFAGVRFSKIAEQVASIRNHHVHVVFVMSGAVALGTRCHVSKIDDRERRHAAAIGQIVLVSGVRAVFHRCGLTAAQVLVSVNDDGSVSEAAHVRRTIDTCFVEGTVPVLNGNDPASQLVNNDILAAKVAELISADQVLILTTPNGSPYSVGGREAKEQASRMLAGAGIPLKVLDGRIRNAILENVL